MNYSKVQKKTLKITLFVILLTVFFVPQKSFSQKDIIYTDVKLKNITENVRALIEKEDWNRIKRIDQEAVEPLIDLLKDRNESIRISSIKMLGTIGDKRATEPLIQILKSNDFHCARYATFALGEINDKLAVEPLIEALSSEILNKYAANALGKIKDTRAVEPLINALIKASFIYKPMYSLMLMTQQRDVYSFQKSIVNALVAIGEPSVKPSLDLLNGKNRFVERDAITILERIGDKRAVDPLLNLFKDKISNLHINAAFALGEIGDIKAVDPLISVINDNEEFYSMRSIEALGKIGDFKAVEPLLMKLADESTSSRTKETIVEALGRIKDKRALNPLHTLFKNITKNDELVLYRKTALALGQLEDTTVINEIIDFTFNYDNSAEIKALKEIGTPAIERLEKNLKSIEWITRKTSADVLAEIAREKAISPISNMLNDRKVYIRETAVEALGKIDHINSTKLLVSKLNDEDLLIRKTAARLLKNNNWIPENINEEVWYLIAQQKFNELKNFGTQSFESLVISLHDKNKEIRMNAAETLKTMGWIQKNDSEKIYFLIASNQWDKAIEFDTLAIKPLINIFQDYDSKMREKSIEALYKIGKSSVELIIPLLKDQRCWVRDAAARTLNEIGWIPENDIDKAWFFVAEKNWDEARKLNLISVDPLMNALSNEYDDVKKYNPSDRGSYIDIDLAKIIEEENKIRINALELLGDLGDKKATESILFYLNYGILEEKEAITALGKIGDIRIVDNLLNVYVEKYHSDELKKVIPKVLGKINDVELINKLSKVLMSQRKEARYCVLEVFKEIKNEKTFDLLVELLDDEDQRIRYYTIQALIEINNPKIINYLESMLIKEESFPVRSTIINFLTKPERQKSHELLVLSLKDKHSRIRSNAALSLGKSGDKRAIKHLISALPDEDYFVRYNIANALGELGGEDSFKALIELLKDENSSVINSSIVSLGKIGNKNAIDFLVVFLKDEQTRKTTALTLKKLEWQPQNISDEILYSILLNETNKINKNDPLRIEELIKLLKSKNFETSKGAANILRNIGWETTSNSEKAWFYFTTKNWSKFSTLDNETEEVLIHMFKFWPSIQSSMLYEMLENSKNLTNKIRISELKNEEKESRLSIAQTLSYSGWKPINTKEKIYFLIASEDFDEISDLGDEAIQPLVKLLQDKDSEIRRYAAKELRDLKWNPKNSTEEAWFQIAAEDWDKLIKIGEPATEPLKTILKINNHRGYSFKEMIKKVLAKIGNIKIINE